eukprot:5902204-Prorocentrum_lima.AAC.1
MISHKHHGGNCCWCHGYHVYSSWALTFMHGCWVAEASMIKGYAFLKRWKAPLDMELYWCIITGKVIKVSILLRSLVRCIALCRCSELAPRLKDVLRDMVLRP